MSNGLIKYDAARLALAECKAVDEVKAWVDKAAAIQAYGRMAKDKTLEVDAAEIRIRAERRLGQMIKAQKEAVGLNTGKLKQGPVLVSDEGGETPTLESVGINYDLSSRSQKLAAVPEEEFEAEVSGWKTRVKEEGARVSARLQAAGERAEKRIPKPVDDQVGRIAELEAQLKAKDTEIANLKEQLSGLADSLRDAQEDNDSMARIVSTDDRLTHMMAELGKFKEQARLNRARVNGLLDETNDLKRMAKSWMRKCQRLEKATKDAGSTPPPEFFPEEEPDPFTEAS